MNYTRKRVLLACDFCRHRKRRCDGGQPCSTCQDAQADCIYKELPVDHVEPSSSSQGAVAERLVRIEAMLEEQGQKLSQALAEARRSTPVSVPSYLSSPQMPSASSVSVSNRSVEGGASPYDAQFLLPFGHSATLLHLLSLPPLRAVVGDFAKSYFLDLEENAGLSHLLNLLQPGRTDWPSFEPDQLRAFADAYFSEVSAHIPLLTKAYYNGLQDRFFQNGPALDIETAICLCVWSLGCIASSPVTAVTLEGTNDPVDSLGAQYFAAALRIIVPKALLQLTPSIQICQALLLAASYFSYLGRPLHGWKLIQSAAQKMLEIHHTRRPLDNVETCDESDTRVFWCCFIMEWAAELDVHRTGMEPLGDSIPLPRSVETRESEHLIYFAAEVAMQRLMNRIYGSLYSPRHIDFSLAAGHAAIPNLPPLNRLLTLTSELDRQLEQYYSTIPIIPPVAVDPVSTDRRRLLTLRYSYGRQVIYRPFVLLVALQPGQPVAGTRLATPSRPPTPQAPPFSMPRIMIEKCQLCIQACEAYIWSAVHILGKRTPYSWSISQSCLVCFVILFLASLSPQLQRLVPDLDMLAGAVTPQVRKWAAPGSSFEALLGILNTMLESRRG